MYNVRIICQESFLGIINMDCCPGDSLGFGVLEFL